jgi:hydrogenase maturation protein HypF
VYALASRRGLSGFVLNDGDGVLAEIEGPALDTFVTALRRDVPPLARIDSIDLTPMAGKGQIGFAIRPSAESGAGRTLVVADAGPCRSCLADLFDPAERFHLYPFVTCTQCGPRFTITRRLPYDRANTAMGCFDLCAACAKDYADPTNRRFHAEAIACPACGPRLSHPVTEIADAIRGGAIVALKGIGGFHLICDATDAGVVERLRRRKRRPERPFAIMVANEASAAGFGRPTKEEFALLRRSARPIVLVANGSGLADTVAPGLERVGLMLPSAPVHHLLFHALAGSPEGLAWLDAPLHIALVATSANLAGQPILIGDDEARRDLIGIADLVVTHDRAILARADDSLMRVIDGAPAYLRRSRGVVPEPIELGSDGPSVLACGAHLKATICVTRGREAFVSQHLGDLSDARTVLSHAETAAAMLTALGVAPESVACDLHPDYRSTFFADSTGLPIVRVQHHAAHLSSVAAEHRLGRPFVGIALDGHGLGDDDAAWGGELILMDGATWHRAGHLLPLALPGGERAAHEPWRMGVAALASLGLVGEAAARFPEAALAGRLASSFAAGTAWPTTTSMGRLFDAASALLGVRTWQSYEGQAAMELEALVRRPTIMTSGWTIAEDVLDFRPLLAALARPGMDPGEGAALFHGTLIAGVSAWAGDLARHTERTDIVLGGGCWANAILAEGVATALRARGLTVWLPRALPANDGGLCLGQAAIARGLADVGTTRLAI